MKAFVNIFSQEKIKDNDGCIMFSDMKMIAREFPEYFFDMADDQNMIKVVKKDSKECIGIVMYYSNDSITDLKAAINMLIAEYNREK